MSRVMKLLMESSIPFLASYRPTIDGSGISHFHQFDCILYTNYRGDIPRRIENESNIR